MKILLQTKAVLFDLGGTLLDYRREEVFRALLEEKGIQLGPQEVIRAYEAVEHEWDKTIAEYPLSLQFSEEPLRRLDRMLLEHLKIPCDLDNIARYVTENRARMDNQLPWNLVRRRYSDVLPCLEKLRNLDLKMGIVSNTFSEEHLGRELEGLELTEYFPVLVASGSVGFMKPDKEIFDIAMKLVQLNPSEIVFVGDDLEPYRGALGVGMNPTLIDRPGKYRELADINRLSSLEELPRLLE